ncbi:MAG TPA: hypothetical protein VF605_14340 [Allosphingosinicella sp.]
MTTDMQRIWQFTPWLPYEIDPGSLVSHCQFLNSDEVFNAGMMPGRKQGVPIPVPEMELTLPDFRVDCFTWDARVLVSQRMREVMALSEDEIEYFPVRATRSAAGPRAMNYMIMNVAVTDRISHPQPERIFSSQHEFLASLMPGPDAIDVHVKPRYRLFHDEHFLGTPYCTDEFAMALLRAGCTGIRFIDPRHNRIEAPMRFRTLRGVEEEGDWDPVNKVEHTTIVEVVADA